MGFSVHAIYCRKEQGAVPLLSLETPFYSSKIYVEVVNTKDGRIYPFLIECVCVNIYNV